MRFGQAVVVVDGESNRELFLGGEVTRAVIEAGSSGNNVVVAAVSGKKIKVLGVFLIASDGVSVKFVSGASTDISGTLPLIASSGFVLPSPLIQEHHWMETAAGEALNINLSGAVQVGGCLLYYVQ